MAELRFYHLHKQAFANSWKTLEHKIYTKKNKTRIGHFTLGLAYYCNSEAHMSQHNYET